MKKYFLVRNAEENRSIQNKLFKLGYEWKILGRTYFPNMFSFPIYIVLCNKKRIKYTYKYERCFSKNKIEVEV